MEIDPTQIKPATTELETAASGFQEEINRLLGSDPNLSPGTLRALAQYLSRALGLKRIYVNKVINKQMKRSVGQLVPWTQLYVPVVSVTNPDSAIIELKGCEEYIAKNRHGYVGVLVEAVAFVSAGRDGWRMRSAFVAPDAQAADRLAELLGEVRTSYMPRVPAPDEEYPPSDDAELLDLSVGAVMPLRSVPEVQEEFNVSNVWRRVQRARLVLPLSTVHGAVTALKAGKNLIIRGAPGTGKTTLAGVLAEAAAAAGMSSGTLQTTGTADWTSADTVGSYRITSRQELVFRAGQFLQAIDSDRWLIVDELNRADIDKAIGQLFTVLSGHPVVLPFDEKLPSGSTESLSGGAEVLPPSIVPPGATIPADTVPHVVPPSWRMIATLNDRDRDLLFDMSEALLRRFAFVDLYSPTNPEDWMQILGSVGIPDSGLEKRLLSLVSEIGSRVGPAILIDCARHLDTGLKEATGSIGEIDLLEQAFDMYIEPHLMNESEAVRLACRAQLTHRPEVTEASSEPEE